MHDNIILTEGGARGFASNIICLLGALEIYPCSKIWIKKPFLSLYSTNERNGLEEYFELGPRIESYNENTFIDSNAEVVECGSTFILPSYKDHIETNGESTEEILTKLSIHYSNNLQFKSIILERMRNFKRLFDHNGYNYAIHRRATDHSMHTKVLDGVKFAERTKKLLHMQKSVYIATDDKDFYGNFRSVLPSINVLSQKSEKSNGQIGIHYSPGAEHDRTRRGFEISYDLLMISRARFLLCGASGIPFLARVINPSLKIINIAEQTWF